MPRAGSRRKRREISLKYERPCGSPTSELIDREQRMVERRIKEARFPTVKSLDSFEFAPPSSGADQ
jgi:DNA replication protein DnaC